MAHFPFPTLHLPPPSFVVCLDLFISETKKLKSYSLGANFLIFCLPSAGDNGFKITHTNLGKGSNPEEVNWLPALVGATSHLAPGPGYTSRWLWHSRLLERLVFIFVLFSLFLMAWCSGYFHTECRVSKLLQEMYSQSILKEQTHFDHCQVC